VAEVNRAETYVLEKSDDPFRADGQAEREGDCSAQDREKRADKAIANRVPGFAEAHPDDHNVSRDRDANRLGDCEQDEREHSVAGVCPVDDPVVEPPVPVPPGDFRVARRSSLVARWTAQFFFLILFHNSFNLCHIVFSSANFPAGPPAVNNTANRVTKAPKRT